VLSCAASLAYWDYFTKNPGLHTFFGVMGVMVAFLVAYTEWNNVAGEWAWSPLAVSEVPP
jgi:hypothetical protein